MIFENLEKAIDSRNRHILCDDNDKFLKHFRKWDFFKNQNEFNHRKFGNFFLYEDVTNGGKGKVAISYPKLAIFVNELIVDQTLDIEYIDYFPRTWEIRSSYMVYHDGNPYKRYVSERRITVKSTILWGDDNLLIYGAWDKMPNWKELKSAYKNTWWYHKDINELRDLKLKSLLR
jgi:hypothetical protein